MTEKLIIKQFAGIESLEIEVKRFTVLIGSQASGKSICAKLLYYFKNMIWESLYAIDDSPLSKKNIDLKHKVSFQDCFPPISWGDNHFLIRYEYKDFYIEVSRLKTNPYDVSLKYAETYWQTVKSIRNMMKTPQSISSPEQLEKFQKTRDSKIIQYISQRLGSKAIYSQIFIPAGRSFFALLQQNIFFFLNKKDELDPFMISFGSLYQSVKRSFLRSSLGAGERQVKLKAIMEQIVDGEYFEFKGDDFIKMKDGRLVPLSSSSSGQQETLPLMMILSTLAHTSSLNNGRTVYIEEPEAHIFPTAQRKLIELIAVVFNSQREDMQFFITTHSPYILTCLNNLFLAGELYRKASKKTEIKKLEKIIPKEFTLLSEDFAVYSLSHNGAKNIFSEETGLIDTNIIDDVSNEMSIEFGQLLDLVG
jgi:AAA15 family ATPase/GTPase